MAELVVTEANGLQSRHALGAEDCLVGTTTDCDVLLKGKKLEGVVASISVQIVISSEPGIYYRGWRTHQQVLRPGDAVEIGEDRRIKLQIEDYTPEEDLAQASATQLRDEVASLRGRLEKAGKSLEESRSTIERLQQEGLTKDAKLASEEETRKELTEARKESEKLAADMDKVRLHNKEYQSKILHLERAAQDVKSNSQQKVTALEARIEEWRASQKNAAKEAETKVEGLLANEKARWVKALKRLKSDREALIKKLEEARAEIDEEKRKLAEVSEEILAERDKLIDEAVGKVYREKEDLFRRIEDLNLAHEDELSAREQDATRKLSAESNRLKKQIAKAQTVARKATEAAAEAQTAYEDKIERLRNESREHMEQAEIEHSKTLADMELDVRKAKDDVQHVEEEAAEKDRRIGDLEDEVRIQMEMFHKRTEGIRQELAERSSQMRSAEARVKELEEEGDEESLLSLKNRIRSLGEEREEVRVLLQGRIDAARAECSRTQAQLNSREHQLVRLKAKLKKQSTGRTNEANEHMPRIALDATMSDLVSEISMDFLMDIDQKSNEVLKMINPQARTGTRLAETFEKMKMEETASCQKLYGEALEGIRDQWTYAMTLVQKEGCREWARSFLGRSSPKAIQEHAGSSRPPALWRQYCEWHGDLTDAVLAVDISRVTAQVMNKFLA